MTKKTRTHDIRISDGWEVPAENGVDRRTLVQGTVWSIPVVAMAVATPAAAASLTTDLAVATVAVGQQDTMTYPTGPVNPGYGLFVDIRVVNNGSATITGVRIAADFASRWTNVNDADTAHRPYITDQTWQRIDRLDYNNPALGAAGDRTVYTFEQPSLTLAPGEGVSVRMYFWVADPVATQGTINVVGRTSLSSGAAESNTSNNEAASQTYTVRAN